MASSLKAGARPCRKIWFLYFIFFSIWICSYVSVCICLFVFVCLYLRSIFSAQQMIKLERWRRCACPPDYLYGKSFFRSSARASTKVFIPASSKRWLGVGELVRPSVMVCDGLWWTHQTEKPESNFLIFSLLQSLPTFSTNQTPWLHSQKAGYAAGGEHIKYVVFSDNLKWSAAEIHFPSWFLWRTRHIKLCRFCILTERGQFKNSFSWGENGRKVKWRKVWDDLEQIKKVAVWVKSVIYLKLI